MELKQKIEGEWNIDGQEFKEGEPVQYYKNGEWKNGTVKVVVFHVFATDVKDYGSCEIVKVENIRKK